MTTMTIWADVQYSFQIRMTNSSNMEMDKKIILVTGANGQLGNEMRNALTGDERFEAIYTDVEELDITSKEAVETFFASHRVDFLVNCAAYTAVDKAEDDAELCRKLNADAVELLATACHAHRTKMVQISTDYVFDGNSCKPYNESDKANPRSVYGSTKLDGELRLMAVAPESVVIRTAWLYSPYGRNFVKTMLTLPASHDKLKVVADQVGTPTYAFDLARAIIAIITAPEWKSGIYHFSNEGVISWYDFTKAIHRIAGITSCEVSPCNSDEYPTRASRPHFSVLDKSKIKRVFGLTIPYWEDSLAHCIARIGDQL